MKRVYAKVGQLPAGHKTKAGHRESRGITQSGLYGAEIDYMARARLQEARSYMKNAIWGPEDEQKRCGGNTPGRAE